jgi:hypothetical protein
METERLHQIVMGLLCVVWLTEVVHAWPALTARVSMSSLVAMITLHGIALWSALRLYLQSRRQPTLVTSRDVSLLFNAWLAAWTIDFSIFSRFLH